jgi:hypothetical protein
LMGISAGILLFLDIIQAMEYQGTDLYIVSPVFFSGT